MAAEDELWQAISGGKPNLLMNYRYEHVEDDLRPEDAKASTLRTVLGYTSGAFHGFGARAALQDVRVIVVDDFDDATGRPNSKTDHAIVADPSETDLLEGYMSYAGIPGTMLKLGRQVITYRESPFHRFVGNVVWRQNWQTHDAFTLQNTSIKDAVIQYAYSWNVNRIFSDEAVVSSQANFDSNSHLINAEYNGFSPGKLEAYAYLLDFNNSAGNSTQTYGARFAGSRSLTGKLKALYALEYARETDYAGNPGNISADYFLGEAGATVTAGAVISAVTLKFTYELLGGDGGVDRFITPLATHHAYQGWADRFLDTPQDGIQDYYLTAIVNAFGATFRLEYHDLNSDNFSYDYGDELDVILTRTFRKHYMFGLKYADYDADRNADNLARNGLASASPRGTVVNDASKFWAFAQIKF
ncbi:MAG: hypothetical protein HYY48_02175 [Gammaproteobacteria bacterium]|nr:hypothetical protein [Gammaproteobacteria bacterium]